MAKQKDAVKDLESQPEDQQPEDQQEPEVQLVKMVRDKGVYPDGPHEADVHPEEVGNYASAGWRVAE